MKFGTHADGHGTRLACTAILVGLIHFGRTYLIDAPDGMRKTMGHCSRCSATKVCQSRAGPGADADRIVTDGSISLNRLARLYDWEVAAKIAGAFEVAVLLRMKSMAMLMSSIICRKYGLPVKIEL